MAYRPLAGYPAPNDTGKYDFIFDLDGPASYNNTGTFNTSGQQINAADFGLGGFESLDAPGMSSDGVNVVEIVLGATIAGTNMGAGGVPGSSGTVATTAVIHWWTNVTRAAEVANTTNLSGKFIRLRIVGV